MVNRSVTTARIPTVFFLYDSTIRVPLLIKFSKGKIRRTQSSRSRQLVDVTPTLLEAIKLPIPATVQGQSLVSLIGAKAAGDRPSLAENEYFASGYGWSFAGIFARRELPVRQGAPARTLRPDSGPRSKTKICLREYACGRAGSLCSSMDFLKRAGANAPEETRASLDPQSVEKLRALGYVASSGTESAVSTVDPKLHIQVANDLHDANLKIEEGKETFGDSLCSSTW